jgi:UDP-N-acetylmuramoyl-tripeptide--D-alanyl-D-alanine ligase
MTPSSGRWHRARAPGSSWSDGRPTDPLGRAGFTLVTATASAPVTLRLSGEHHVANALAVAAVGIECGLGVDEVVAALSQAVAVSAWRMQVTERADGVIVINDAYNANPESMRAALETLQAVGQARPDARTWAVLGPMAELGADSEAAHRELGQLVATLGLARLVVVGGPARPIVDGAVLEGWAAAEPDWVADAESATRLVEAQLRDGDVVLVKASRAAGLERVALALAQTAGPAAGNRGEQA